MTIKGIAPQLRTTDMNSSIRFYTEKLGFEVAFKFEDFYAGITAGENTFHLKLFDKQDPSIPFVEDGDICISISKLRRKSSCRAFKTQRRRAHQRRSRHRLANPRDRPQ